MNKSFLLCGVVLCVCACANSTRFPIIYICYPLIAVIVHHLNGRCSSDFTRGLCRRFQCRPHDVQSLAKCQPIGRCPYKWTDVLQDACNKKHFTRPSGDFLYADYRVLNYWLASSLCFLYYCILLLSAPPTCWCTVWRDFRHLGSQCSHLNRIFHNITAFWIVTFILT